MTEDSKTPQSETPGSWPADKADELVKALRKVKRPQRELTTRELVVEKLAPVIEQWREEDWTWAEIEETLKGEGVEVSLRTLKAWVNPPQKVGKPIDTDKQDDQADDPGGNGGARGRAAVDPARGLRSKKPRSGSAVKDTKEAGGDLGGGDVVPIHSR